MSWKNDVIEYLLKGDLHNAIDFIALNLDQEEKPIRVLLGLQCYIYQNAIRLEQSGLITTTESVGIKEKIVQKILEVSFE